jgi:hypothetical protein
MRSLFFSLILAGMGPSLQAQNTAQIQQSTQSAVQAAQQANRASVRATQQANGQAVRDSQQAGQNAAATQQRCRDCAARTPRFSMKSGTYSAPFTVTITADRNAAIYYTLDGWTPTFDSEKYNGPIEVESTITLQAIAISPRGVVSRVTIADFKLPDGEPMSVFPGLPPVEIPNAASSGRPVIPKGTPVPLAFVSPVNSKTARVGDKLALVLAQDVTSDGVVLLNKGTPSIATITEIDTPKAMGVPAEIFFKADYIQADGTAIKLHGSAAKQGQDQEGKAAAHAVVVPGGLFVHGKDAEIHQGAVFTAYVDTDTPLRGH